MCYGSIKFLVRIHRNGTRQAGHLPQNGHPKNARSRGYSHRKRQMHQQRNVQHRLMVGDHHPRTLACPRLAGNIQPPERLGKEVANGPRPTPNAVRHPAIGIERPRQYLGRYCDQEG